MKKIMNTLVNAILIFVILYTGYQLISPYFGSSGNTESSGSYQKISPEQAKERLDKEDDIILLDVRTKEEYQQSRIPDSVLLPLQTLEKEVVTVIPDKDTTVFIYCRTGNRSAQAAKIMVKLGYTNVYDLGGIVSWPYDIEP